MVTLVNVTYTEIREGEGAQICPILNETVDEAINFGVTATARFSVFHAFMRTKFPCANILQLTQYLDMDNSDIGDFMVPNVVSSKIRTKGTIYMEQS